MGHDQNLMLFPNMDSEVVCLFFFEKDEGTFEKHSIGLGGKQTGFLLTSISPFVKTLKIVGVGDL